MKHFEDLPAKDILEFIKRPDTFTCTEKLDGSHIIVGRDSKGFYTRRENKEKYYCVSDYDSAFFTNYQKLALDAVLLSSRKLTDIIKVGEELGAEVIVNLQPNVVFYPNNHECVKVVLFTDKKFEAYGGTNEVDLLTTVPGSFEDTDVKTVRYRYEISTLSTKMYSIPTYNITFFMMLLAAKQTVSGVDIVVQDILDWPLNKRYPADFDHSWQEVKEEFKELRKRYREILRERKMDLSPTLEAPFNHSVINEGFVVSDGNIEFKLVDQNAFLEAKNFIWKYRDMIKSAKKEVGTITTMEQADELQRKYNMILDKYLANVKDEECHVRAITGIRTISRGSTVKARDKSAFVTAFRELNDIKSQLEERNS